MDQIVQDSTGKYRIVNEARYFNERLDDPFDGEPSDVEDNDRAYDCLKDEGLL